MPNVVFLIVGDGPLFQEILDDIEKMGLKRNILMMGYNADIQSLLRRTHILLLPSFLELHSIAYFTLEAMSMKVPVVVSKEVGCNSEFIDDWQNGVLLDPFKDEGWAEAIIRLLKDAPLRGLMGEKGHQTCLEKFDIKDAAKRFEDLYVELTGI